MLIQKCTNIGNDVNVFSMVPKLILFDFIEILQMQLLIRTIQKCRILREGSAARQVDLID